MLIDLKEIISFRMRLGPFDKPIRSAPVRPNAKTAIPTSGWFADITTFLAFHWETIGLAHPAPYAEFPIGDSGIDSTAVAPPAAT